MACVKAAYGRAGRALGDAGLLGGPGRDLAGAGRGDGGDAATPCLRARTAVLAGFGAVVAVLALGRYYYDLQATLLVKAGWMVLGGVFCSPRGRSWALRSGAAFRHK